MEQAVFSVRWLRVIVAGSLPLVLTHLALLVPTIVVPGFGERFGTWVIAAWTLVWTTVMATAVVATVPKRDAARHGLAVGAVAALLGLFFYGTFGLGAALLFALTIGAGWGAGLLLGRR